MTQRLPARTLAAAALLMAGAAPAGAAVVPDRVLAEVDVPFDVGIDGQVVVWTHGTRAGAELVVTRSGRVLRRIPAGVGRSRVDVGHTRSGRRTIAYIRCGRSRSCEIRALPVTRGPSVLVARVSDPYDVSVAAGRVHWIDGSRVLSRALSGGPVRREAVAAGLDPVNLDTDGGTLAVTGPGPEDDFTASSLLSVTRPGSGRARVIGGTSFSQELRVLGAPVVTAAGVSALLFQMHTATAGRILAPTPGGSSARRGTGGMAIVGWDAAGRDAVMIEGATESGCGVGDPFLEIEVAQAPCRIVVARLDAERLLPPRVRLDAGRPGEPRTATVLRTRLSGGRVTGQEPQAGVRVEVREGAEVVALLRTDAGGRVTLPDANADSLVAATDPAAYAYVG